MLIAPDLLWHRGALREGMGVTLSDSRIAAVGPLAGRTPDLRPHLVLPGGTDLQVNGGGGVLFNTSPTAEGALAILAAHRTRGTAAILPTVISDTPDVAEAAADAVIAARRGDPFGIAGIHLEGPHLAPDKRGTHDPDRLRPLDDRTLALALRLRQADVPVLLTLAPERAAPDMLRRLAGAGVVLSAGHSMATAAEARAAFAQGVTMATHLYNAMPPLNHRDPGLAAAAILSDVWIGLIADGHHVAWEMLRLALAARPAPGRCFLVSDAMPTVAGPHRFTLYGREISVRDGRLVNAEGALAGAHVDLLDSMGRLHRQGDVPLADCIAMAVDAPRAAMRLQTVGIEAGLPTARVALLDEGLGFTGWLGDLPGTGEG